MSDARVARKAKRGLRWVAAAGVVAALAGGVALLMRAKDEPIPDGIGYEAALEAARTDPLNAAKWLRVGDLAMEKDAYARAENAYGRAHAAAPRDPAILVRLATVAYAADDDQKARQHLEQARLLGSTDPAGEALLEQIVARESERNTAANDALDDAKRRHAAAIAARAAAMNEGTAAMAGRVEALKEGNAALAAQSDAMRAEADERKARFEAARAERIRRTGHCTLPLGREGNALTLDLSVNGAPLRMIVDTGATMTAFTTDAAEKAGLDIDPTNTRSFVTANGTVESPIVRIAGLEVAELTTGTLDVAVCDTCKLGPLDGLFGLDAVHALGLEIDPIGKRALLRDCTP